MIRRIEVISLYRLNPLTIFILATGGYKKESKSDGDDR